MSAISNLVLNNESAVAVTFVPVVGYQGKHQGASYQSVTGCLAPIEYPRIDLNMRRSSNRSTHVDFKVSVPYVTNDPVKGPTLVCTAMYSPSAGFIIPDNCPVVIVNRLYAFVKNLVAHAVISTAVTTFDMPR